MLSRELVKKHMMRLIDAYGTPDHIQSADDLARWIDFYHKELSRNFNDRNFQKGCNISVDCRNTSRSGMPRVFDFYKGFDGASNDDDKINRELGLLN